MRDDLPRLLAPATLPNGAPNPAHMSKAAYLERGRAAAVQAAAANGVDPRRLTVDFPDAASFAPVRAKVAVSARVELGPGRDPARTEASAEAEAAPVAGGSGAMPA